MLPVLNFPASSDVTVCANPSLFWTVTVAPDFTDTSGVAYAVFWITIVPAGALELGPDPELLLLLEHAANPSASPATATSMRSRRMPVIRTTDRRGSAAFPRKAQRAFADDVALDLVGAGP